MTMQNSVSCDQVFERLTRGPFPDNDPSLSIGDRQFEASVQRHLDCCHECRSMAEALRPAVAWVCEAVGAPESHALPSYNSLGERVNRSAMTRAESKHDAVMPWDAPLPARHLEADRVNPFSSGLKEFGSFGQVLAVMTLCLGLAGCLAFAMRPAEQDESASQSLASTYVPDREGSPSVNGIAFLVSLGTKPICIEGPNSSDEFETGLDDSIEHTNVNDQRSIAGHASTAETSEPFETTSESAANDAPARERARDVAGATYHCCTECHAADRFEHRRQLVSATVLAKACAVCHL